MSAQAISHNQHQSVIQTLERQCMLSQRIVLFLYAATLGDRSALDESKNALAYFEHSHVTLCQRDPGFPGREAIDSYIQRVRQCLYGVGQGASTSMSHTDMLVLSGGVLQVLDHALYAYRKQSEMTQSPPSIPGLAPSREVAEMLFKIVFEFKLLATNARIIAAHAGVHDDAAAALGSVCDQMHNLSQEIARVVQQLLRPLQ